MGRLKAQDPDLGDNALMAYSILDGEGSEAFSISTDSQGQDGLLTVRKVSFPPLHTCRPSWEYRAQWEGRSLPTMHQGRDFIPSTRQKPKRNRGPPAPHPWLT